MIIHSPIFSGSINQAESAYANLSGSFTGSFKGIGQFEGLEADSVAYDNVTGKPTLVSGSSQVSYPDLSNIPSGIVSSSAQLSEIFLDTLGDGVVSGSSQVSYPGLSNIPAGIVSGSSQINSQINYQNVTSSIIPSVTDTYDLGSPEKQWRDLYLSSASLFIDGIPVLSSTAAEIVISSGVGQSIKLNELGTDDITFQTQDGNIELKSSGGGDILLDPTDGLIAVRGTFQIQDTQKITSSGGTRVVVGNNLEVTGSINSTSGITATSFNGTINANNGVISGSSQVSYPNLSNIPSGIVSGSSQVTSLLPSGVVSGSTQVQFNDITNNPFSHSGSDVTILAGKKIRSSDENTIVIAEHLDVEGNITVLGAVDGVDIAAFKSDFDAFKQSTFVTGSSQVTYASISSIPAGIVSGSSQVTPLLPSGVVSGSTQVNADSITNFDTNVKDKLNTDLVVSGSATQVKTFLSLQNVTNESKATMFTSPTFTGTPVAPTAPANTNSTQIATTAYVQQELTDLIGGANEAFDTLLEISASLAAGDSQLNTLVDGKLSKASNLSDLTDTSAARTNLGLVIGTNVQAFNSTLASVAAGTYTGDDSITTIGTVNAGSVTAILPTGVVSGSGQVLGGTGIVSGSSQVTPLLPSGVVSGSSQVVYTSLSSIPAGIVSGSSQISLSGFSTTNLSEGTNLYYTDARVKTKLNTDGVISGSSQINVASTTGDIALGTRTSGNYVASLVAGTGVTLTNNSGEGATPTIAIGQAVATNSEVQFAKVGVGGAADATYELRVTGDIGATGDIVAYVSSDERLKNNVELISNPIEKVQALRGVTWEWNELASDAAKQSPNVGVIAQEVENVLPQLVHDRENGFKGVDYAKLTGLLIEAIKEQQKQIDELKSRL